MKWKAPWQFSKYCFNIQLLNSMELYALIRKTWKYLQQLIREDHTLVDLILKSPSHQDEMVWKYEHLRQFCMDLNLIAVKLQRECTPQTCTQMTATEQWIFLCAAHKNPKEVNVYRRKLIFSYNCLTFLELKCSAIDYTRHTLDGAACLLNSNRYFPSRYVKIKLFIKCEQK